MLQIATADTGRGHATLYSIGQSPDGIPIASLTLQGSNLKFAIPATAAAYEGTVSADGGSIQGTWTQGKNSLPLTFQSATKETAWPTDSSPHSVKFITVDADVKLEVLDWGGSGRPLVLLAGLGDTVICPAFEVIVLAEQQLEGFADHVRRRNIDELSIEVQLNLYRFFDSGRLLRRTVPQTTKFGGFCD